MFNRLNCKFTSEFASKRILKKGLAFGEVTVEWYSIHCSCTQ